MSLFSFLMFAYLKPPPVAKELFEFTEELTKTVTTLETQSTAFSNLSNTILVLIQKETPNFIPYFEKISQVYERLSNIYQNSAYAVDRAIEDLRDINARFGVVKRVESERGAAKAHFNNACKEADAAYKAIQQEKPQTTTFYKNCIKKRSEMAQKLVEKDQELLEQRKKYRAFSMRRIKSAWQRYGTALAELYVHESATFNELATLFRSIKEHSTEPEKILSKVITSPPPLLLNNASPNTIETNINNENQQNVDNQEQNADLDISAPALDIAAPALV